MLLCVITDMIVRFEEIEGLRGDIARLTQDLWIKEPSWTLHALQESVEALNHAVEPLGGRLGLVRFAGHLD